MKNVVLTTEDCPVVYIKDIDANMCGKLYLAISKGLEKFWKLHRVSTSIGGSSKWVFVSLVDSMCYLNGYSGSPEAAIRKSIESGYSVHEFDTLKEMAEFIVEKC